MKHVNSSLMSNYHGAIYKSSRQLGQPRYLKQILLALAMYLTVISASVRAL